MGILLSFFTRDVCNCTVVAATMVIYLCIKCFLQTLQATLCVCVPAFHAKLAGVVMSNVSNNGKSSRTPSKFSQHQATCYLVLLVNLIFFPTVSHLYPALPPEASGWSPVCPVTDSGPLGRGRLRQKKRHGAEQRATVDDRPGRQPWCTQLSSTASGPMQRPATWKQQNI